jgi:hypothetical protein
VADEYEQCSYVSGIQLASGHHDYSKSYYITEANPQIYRFSLVDPTAAPLQLANLLCPGNVWSGCTDSHLNANVNNDTDPVLGTSAATLLTPWTAPYRNEMFGVNMDGSGIIRFCKTYSSGVTGKTNFWAQYAIGAPSQARKLFFFTSDMLGALGPVPVGPSAGLNRWDVFACGIAGQLNGPTLPTGLTATVQ